MEALDMVFGVDMSSRSSSHFDSMKNFMEDFTKILSSYTKYLNLGSLKYGGEAVVTFPFQLKPSSSPSSLNEAFLRMVERLSAVDNGRSLDSALLKAYEAFFKPQHNQPAGAHLTVDRIKELISAGREKIIRDGEQKLNRNKLLVLLVGGNHINSDLDILPKHAARLLYDIGVQIIIVTFSEVDDQVKAIALNPNKDIFEANKGVSPVSLLKALCKRFGTSKYNLHKFTLNTSRVLDC